MKKKAVYLLAVAALSASVCMMTGCGANQDNSNSNSNTSTEGKADSNDSGLEINTSVFDSYKASDYVKLPDYKNLAVDVEFDESIKEEEVKEFVNTVCSYYPLVNPEAKTVKNGDFVDIDYEGKKDGVAFEGGTAEGYILEIGSGNFIDGFESGLIGKNVGETVDLNLTFPENYQSAELAGADVVFTVKINGICYNYDTLTDDYVKGQFEETMNLTTVDAFLEKANESVKSDKETQKNSAAREACAKKLTELSEVTLPDGLVDFRLDQYFKQFENFYLSSNGYTLENYVKDNLNMTMEEFRESERNTIEGELKQELALKAFAEAEGLEIEDEAFEAYVNEVVEANKMTDAEALYSAYDTDLQSGRDYLWSRYYLIEAITKLKDYCDFNYVTGSEK
ncbi:MAG: trigger factor [Lachnospiraceae bacterium]|nr:trigger factor [Lachnospiraceae bacterium]